MENKNFGEVSAKFQPEEAGKEINLETKAAPKKRPSRAKVSNATTSPLAQELRKAAPVEMTKEEKMKTVEWQRQRDKEMVKGKFINIEQPGAPLEFPYKAYKGDNVEMYSFQDGEVKTVPYGVARHIQQNCSTPKYEHLTADPKMISGINPDNRGQFKVTTLVNRFAWIPLDYRESDFEGPTFNQVVRVDSMKQGWY